MIIAFQVILLIIIFGSGMGVMNEEDKKLQENMAFTCVMAMGSFIVSVVWL